MSSTNSRITGMKPDLKEKYLINARVSVVILCYNHGDFLGEAVNSVLESDFGQCEIIIVNDDSTDPYTLDVFKEMEQRFYRSKERTIGIVNRCGH